MEVIFSCVHSTTLEKPAFILHTPPPARIKKTRSQLAQQHSPHPLEYNKTSPSIRTHTQNLLVSFHYKHCHGYSNTRPLPCNANKVPRLILPLCKHYTWIHGTLVISLITKWSSGNRIQYCSSRSSPDWHTSLSLPPHQFPLITWDYLQDSSQDGSHALITIRWLVSLGFDVGVLIMLEWPSFASNRAVGSRAVKVADPPGSFYRNIASNWIKNRCVASELSITGSAAKFQDKKWPYWKNQWFITNLLMGSWKGWNLCFWFIIHRRFNNS